MCRIRVGPFARSSGGARIGLRWGRAGATLSVGPLVVTDAPTFRGGRDAVLGDPVARLGRGAREARQTAAGAACLPYPRGPAGQRDPHRRPDAGSGAAVAPPAADRPAAEAEDRRRHGMERGGRLSGRRPDEHPLGGVAGRPEKAEAPSLPAGRGAAGGAGRGQASPATITPAASTAARRSAPDATSRSSCRSPPTFGRIPSSTPIPAATRTRHCAVGPPAIATFRAWLRVFGTEVRVAVVRRTVLKQHQLSRRVAAWADRPAVQPLTPEEWQTLAAAEAGSRTGSPAASVSGAPTLFLGRAG